MKKLINETAVHQVMFSLIGLFIVALCCHLFKVSKGFDKISHKDSNDINELQY